jgi:hypothetical protein
LADYLEEWVEGLAISRENSTVENYGTILRFLETLQLHSRRSLRAPRGEP